MLQLLQCKGFRYYKINKVSDQSPMGKVIFCPGSSVFGTKDC